MDVYLSHLIIATLVDLVEHPTTGAVRHATIVPMPPSPILATRAHACAAEAQQQFMPRRQQQAPPWGPGNHLSPLAGPPLPGPGAGRDVLPDRGGAGGGMIPVVMYAYTREGPGANIVL